VKVEEQLPPQIADRNAPLSPIDGLPQQADLPTPGGTSSNSPIDLPGIGEAPFGDDRIVGQPTAIIRLPPGVPGTVPAANDLDVTQGRLNPGTTQPPVRQDTPVRTVAGATEHVVARGDSLARIAKTRLGAESRWTEIADLNPGVNPKALVVGQKLRLPSGAAPVAAARETKPEPKDNVAAKRASVAVAKNASKAAPRTAVVRKGDTLRSIARRELGDERRWKEIQTMNPGLEPSKLAIGQRVKLPAGSGELIAAAEAPAPSKKPRVQ
jgi:nucleoid-associated protein YgaU